MKTLRILILPKTLLACLALCALVLSSTRVAAQPLRDPTVPPAPAALAGSEAGAGMEPGAMAVVVRDGKPYLAVGARLYAVGQMLEQARIERISETQVWLREGGVLRKVDLFAGIERSATTLSAQQSPQYSVAPAPNPKVHSDDQKSQKP